MRTSVRIIGVLALALTVGCASGGAGAQATSTPRPAVTLLIEARGVTMPLTSAVHKIGFAPFIPPAQMVSIAVIPPLGGNDSRATRGLAIEYEHAGEALLLSQWPRSGFDIAVGGFDATSRPCVPVAYMADGLLWTTRAGRVMTLQPDGTVASSRIAREADRLLRAGACGQPAKAFSRPLPAPRPSSIVSSPRRSAS